MNEGLLVCVTCWISGHGNSYCRLFFFLSKMGEESEWLWILCHQRCTYWRVYGDEGKKNYRVMLMGLFVCADEQGCFLWQFSHLYELGQSVVVHLRRLLLALGVATTIIWWCYCYVLHCLRLFLFCKSLGHLLLKGGQHGVFKMCTSILAHDTQHVDWEELESPPPCFN